MNDCVLVLSEPGTTEASKAQPLLHAGDWGYSPLGERACPHPAPWQTLGCDLQHQGHHPPQQALVSSSLCYHFEMTMNSGTWWTIWKTQISQKKREKRNEIGMAEILPFNDNCPDLIF